MDMVETPSDIFAERIVLGVCLTNPSLMMTITNQVRIKDFYLDKHKLIYEAIQQIVADRLEVDRVTVGYQLNKNNTYQSAGGMDYILKLDEDIPAIPNIQSYIAILREKTDRRRLQLTYNEVGEKLKEPGENVKNIIEF